MKPKILITLTALLVLLPVLSLTSQAQRTMLLRVDVPFAFIAGGVHLPPGQYVVFRDTPWIEFLKVDGRASAWVPVQGPSRMESEQYSIVFNRYGEIYFLAQVKTGHNRNLYQCNTCRGERELAAKYRASEVETVAMNAK